MFKIVNIRIGFQKTTTKLIGMYTVTNNRPNLFKFMTKYAIKQFT